MTDNTVATKIENLRALIELMDPKELEAVLEQSHGFADSLVLAANASERKAWKVSFAFGCLALVLAGAIYAMMPLKTIVSPKVYMVDRELATVTELQTLEEVRVSIQEAATRKAVNDFLLAREAYTKDTAELNYNTAAAFMSAPLQVQWAAYWDQSNENSPFKVYKNDIKVRPEILTITPTAAPGVATARVRKWMKRGEGEPVPTVVNATLTYKYVNPPTEEKIRRVNPFGFQIIDYRTDPEIGGIEPKRVPEAAVAVPAPANVAPAGLVAPQITPQVVRREAQ